MNKPSLKSVSKGFRRVLSVGAASAVALTLASSVYAADLRLKIAGTVPVDHEGTKMLKQIEKEIEAADVGLKVSVFPASQLGSGESLVEDTIRGNVDFVMAFIYSHKDPVLDIMSMPYLFTSWDDLENVMLNPDSEYNKIINERLENLGLKLFNHNPEGFVGVVANKKPEDYAGFGDKGMNIRVWSSAVVKDMAETLGYNTTTMAWGDMFPAMQSGIVDGTLCCTKQAAYTIFAKSNVGKYFVEYNAISEINSFYGSLKTWNKMNDEQKAVVKAAFDKASKQYFQFNKENDANFKQKLVESGYEVLSFTPEQEKVLAERVREKVWPAMAEVVGQDTIDRLKKDFQ
ncbi:TRAP transporter substrate-binding protein DctP [Pseudovibrio sp. Ad26]|uniref:TRAP transporter substrate-binding protein DctP n=1 Tax=Pseudovibrio sp. Ad26 TaxID=989410 RepID=UPI0007AE71A2|nr:TRAP transporter substrate-binding protein DctP [Pseudovibrio sp. Ad26]KZL06651.1 Sialic acid-binding periplasmic protein SiaP precursor [Pseudovibrio sp. Ad26]